MDNMSEVLMGTLTLYGEDESLESEGSDFEHSYKYESIPALTVYINGNMRIELMKGDYYLFGVNNEDFRTSLIEVDSQGFATLTPDLHCPLDVTRCLSFYPHLEKLKGEVEGLQMLGRKKKKRMNLPFWDNRYEWQGQQLWNRLLDPSDELVCRQLQTQAGPVEICFAAFVDAIEAMVDITLSNWRVGEAEDPIKLYGRIIAKSSLVPNSQARSILFQREKTANRYFCVDPSKHNMGDIPLPQSRHKVVLSRHATLQVYIDISRCFTDTDSKRIARCKVEFITKPTESFHRDICTDSLRVIETDDFDIQVKVKWLHDTRVNYEGDDSSKEDGD